MSESPAIIYQLRHNDLILRPGPETPAEVVREELAPYLGERLRYDTRLNAWRALPIDYAALRERLDARFGADVQLPEAPALELPLRPLVPPRPYQEAALTAWLEAGGRGVVVLPTGAGKTLVALLAIASMGRQALMVVPTLDLLEQWAEALIRQLGAPRSAVGRVGGGERDWRPLTVITYDSAAIHTRELHRFGLLVFDEVHHLPAESYRRIALGTLAPWRLGLSATPERADLLHRDLDELVGPVVFRREAAELAADRHIAQYIERRLDVALTSAEAAEYEAAMTVYRDYKRARRVRIESAEDFQREVIWRSAYDSTARAAFVAYQRARGLALNASAKLELVEELLDRHRADQVILFSEYNALVERLSRRCLLPAITYKTKASERRAILEAFRAGRYSKLITGRVLNEGVDVPDANIGIIISGSGVRREQVQRLGRLLRPKATPAILYELVTAETAEVDVARRRRTSS